MLNRFSSFLVDHAAAMLGTGVGTVTSLGFAVGAVPVPNGIPTWLPVLLSACAPFLSILALRFVGAFAASRRSMAESKRKRAAKLLTDGDKTNDDEAHKLEDEADALDAQAKAADALGKK